MKGLTLRSIARLFGPGVLMLVTFVGCGPGGPDTYPVQGTVTYDGKPVKEGDILFIPNDASLAAEGGKIIDGKYEMVSKAGVCLVKISALNIDENTEWVSGSPIASNYIPERYNQQTILTADITADNDNQFDFALTSEPVSD